jgi:hypothetical protein
MSNGISVWALLGPSLQTAYATRYQWEIDFPDIPYEGPMDDTTYAIMNSFADMFTVGPMYESIPDEDDEIFRMYGMNFADETEAINAMDHLIADWPGKQIDVLGAWSAETGLQMGLSYDEEANIIGTPVYPIPADAYLVMPPIVVYDENGDEVSSTPPTSNADLRDINILSGQALRIFT